MTGLATLEKITEIKPIEGADRIQAARILGYWTVIKKGEFNVGDLCVWHNPDTIIDILNPAYSFLKQDRVKAIRLRGQVSQGLALPLKAFNWDAVPLFYEGLDVSEHVKIRKYEKPEASGFGGSPRPGRTLKTFPNFIPKTDEQNLRRAPKLVQELLASPSVNITVKIDGQSGTFYKNDDHFGVCSRNQELREDEASGFWQLANKYGIPATFKNITTNFALQGECYGPGIQGNRTGAKEVSLGAFNLYNIDANKYMDPFVLREFCQQNNIPMVQTVYAGPLGELMPNKSIDDLVDFANRQFYAPGLPAEGIVIRPEVSSTSDALGGRQCSGKIISDVFCLKYGE